MELFICDVKNYTISHSRESPFWYDDHDKYVHTLTLLQVEMCDVFGDSPHCLDALVLNIGNNLVRLK